MEHHARDVITAFNELINYIQKLLRVKMIEEWNTNHEHYQGFITADIPTLTHEYLQDGQYSGCVGTNFSQHIADAYNYFLPLFQICQCCASCQQHTRR